MGGLGRRRGACGHRQVTHRSAGCASWRRRFEWLSASLPRVPPNSTGSPSQPRELTFICNLTAYTPLNNKRTINLIKSPSDWKLLWERQSSMKAINFLACSRQCQLIFMKSPSRNLAPARRPSQAPRPPGFPGLGMENASENDVSRRRFILKCSLYPGTFLSRPCLPPEL